MSPTDTPSPINQTQFDYHNPLSPATPEVANPHISSIPITPNELWQGNNPFPTNNQPSPPRITRLLFQNLNGLRKYNDTLHDSLSDLYHTLQNYGIDIACVSEHHLAAQQPATKVKLKQAINQIAPRGHIHARFDSSNVLPSESGRLIGGTGIINTPGTIGRMSPQNSNGGDPLGRWSYCTYARQNLPDLVIISIYQVCRQPTNQVGQTAWHQQRCLLDQQHRHQTHPRTAFLEDLEAFLDIQQSKNHEIIIGGDWNDYVEAPRSTILRLSTKFNLCDPWLHSHPSHETFATHARGQQRIDSVLVSTTLLPAITNICYSPTGYLVHSDHRGLLIDFSTPKLFTNKRDDPETYLPRLVRSKDMKSVITFVENWHRKLTEHDAFAMVDRLQNIQDLNPEAILLVEELDSILGITGQQSEQKCKKRRATWYSRQLVLLRNEISTLKYYRNAMRNNRNLTLSTQAKLQNIQSTLQLPETLQTTNEMIDAKIQELNALRKKSLEVRLEEAANALVPSQIKPKRKKDPRIKINKAEVGAKMWRSLKAIKGSYRTQAITRIEVPIDWPHHSNIQTALSSDLSDPKTAVQWRQVDDPEHIEQYLLLRNRKHFGQAHGTPFTRDDITSLLDWGATTETAKTMLEGKYIPPESFSAACQSLLNHCRSHTSSDQPDANIQVKLSYDEFKGKITKWRETTTTSPSGRHLGWYRSLFKKGAYSPSTSAEALEFADKQKSIVHIILAVSNFCLETGYVISRWRQVTNMMILKDEFNFQIHRLRIIHLYEADLNLIFAVKWRNLMHCAENNHTINTNQYGSRPGREATTLSLLEEVKTDISYLSRRTLLTFDNDAASCYDRIIPAFASLIHRKYGLPSAITKLHGNMLRQAEYKLKTTNGISSSGYSHSDENPIYGTGQGSGNSPMIWLLMSATLFDCYETHTHGATFRSPDNQESTQIHISGFVDDTNISLNSWEPQQQQPLSLLLPKLQTDAQWWNDLLYASGGKLELSKCSFHALEFHFRPNGTPYVTGATVPPIQLRDSFTQASIDIPSLPAAAPHKTLGHWKAPSGRATTQLRHLTSKAKTISMLIATSPIPRYGAKLAYQAIYIAFLRYILPQCHFSPRILRRAEKLSIAAIISKCGFSSRSPHAVLFTPTGLGGGGFLHWSTIQATGQILHFLKHWRSNEQPAQLLRIGVAWAQWQAGTRQSIFQETNSDRSYVEARWLNSFRAALRSANASLRLHTSFVQKPERQGDKFIMNVACQLPCFSPHELHVLNCCRLYLHVTTTSELFDVSGNNILRNMLQGQRPRWFDPSLMTAIQTRPSENQWKKVWQRFCDIIKMTGTTLGRFIVTDHPLRLRRESYCENSRVYYWHAGQYWLATLHNPPSTYRLRRATSWVPTAGSIPIDTIARIGTTIYCDTAEHARAYPDITRQAQSIPETFEEYISQLPRTYQRLLLNTRWIVPPFQALESIITSTTNQPILIVSDGSVQPGKLMSYGVVIGTSSGTILCESKGPADGPFSSHRAECTGSLVGGLILTHLVKFTHTDRPLPAHLRAISDNQSLIRSLNERWRHQTEFTNSKLRSDWDLLEETHSVYQELNAISTTFQWVKGHQDRSPRATMRTKVDDGLPIDAIYNIRADELASHFIVNHPQRIHQRRLPLLPTTQCHLDINGTTVTGQYGATINKHISLPEYRAYLQGKHQWDDVTWNAIDWDAIEMATRNYFSTEVHLTKLIHNLLPTKAKISRYQPWSSPQCQFCSEPETFLHIQQCRNHPASIKFRANLPTVFQRYFDQHKAPQAFRCVFLAALQESTSPSTSVSNATIPDEPEPPPAIRHQRRIGVHLFTRGFLSTQWRTTLEQSLADVNLEYLLNQLQVNPYLRTGSAAPAPAPPIDATVFIAGLIKLMWSELGTLWLDHLTTIHVPATKSKSAVTQAQLRQHFLCLQRLKPHVSPASQNTYFPIDSDRFVARSTDDQLRRYLHLYKPLILAEIEASFVDDVHPTITGTYSELIRTTFSWTPPPPETAATQQDMGHPAQSQAPHRTRNRLRPSF